MVPGDVSKGPWGIPAKKNFKLHGDLIIALNFFISSQRLCSLCIIYAKLCEQLVPETCRRFSAKLFESAVIVFHHMIYHRCETIKSIDEREGQKRCRKQSMSTLEHHSPHPPLSIFDTIFSYFYFIQYYCFTNKNPIQKSQFCFAPIYN